MAKKIYDIKPPKVVHKIEKELRATSVTVKRKKRVQEVVETPKTQRKKEKQSIWLPAVICVLIVILVGLVYLYFKLPKADITIWPKVETLSFQQTINADKSVSLVDTVGAVIPAEYFQATKTITQDFPATGNASNEGKASGNITIYNKYDPPTPLTFRAGTHFMSDSGKLFVTFQKVVVPAAKKVGNKITPGSVQIQVQAVEGGSDYNIAPSNFSMPGLKGTAYYYSVSAVSTSAMTGGYTGKVKKVTSDDIQGAKDVLTKKATADAMDDLKSQISSEYVLLENAVLSNTTDASTETKPGAVAENFNYKVTVTVSALVFKKADLDQFAKDYIASQMPEGKTLLESNFKNSYSASSVDVSGGKATLNLDFSSGVYRDIDKNYVALSLLGENADQITTTINNSLGDQVTNLQINFWPFWVSAVPNNQKAVNVELKFE